MSLNLVQFKATTIADAWFRALRAVFSGGRKYFITGGSFEGSYRNTIHACIDIEYPGTRPLAPILRPNMLTLTTEEQIQEYFARYLMSDVKSSHEHYTYGEDLHWQVEWVINHYKTKGFGNAHGYMTIGRPEGVFNYDIDIGCIVLVGVKNRETGEIIQKREISNQWNLNPKNRGSSQCMRGIDTWIEEDEQGVSRLHFWVYFRSWDLLSGFPENLGGIQLVKEYMVSELDGVEDGDLVVSSKDLHVYVSSQEIAEVIVGLEKELDSMESARAALEDKVKEEK